MKKLFFTLSFVLTALTLSAIPAKRGQWQTLTLSDGTEIRAQLMGDEHLHFWQAENGQRYTIQDDGTAVKANMEQMRLNAQSRRSGKTTATRLRSPRRISIGEKTHYTGQKKGIVILMQFTDTKFKSANDHAKYNDILNKENYSSGSFKGSVADYFKAQSNGQFELSFDVLGPYDAENKYSYYGKNDSYGNDMYPDKLVVEAVKKADSEVNFQDYDWDGDGRVDQVFILYAGKGEATSNDNNTIWPHMWYLSETGREVTLDDVIIDTYACSNEVTTTGAIEGIGAFCHEFSHCLGYPDFYDISYAGWFGMNQFDLMDQGSYNGDGFRPSGYTAYEKWMAGWLEPIVLAEENVTVENLVATSENGAAYIMYNDGWQDEYYMIENRQKTNWDTNIPDNGLMITHVDFDKEIWEQNTPNARVTQSDVNYSNGEYTKANGHQRYTIFHADDNDDSSYWNTTWGGYSQTTLTTDLYPNGANDSLTATSKPAASLFNKDSRGKKFMQGAILKIKQNSDKTVSFFYRAKMESSQEEKPDDPEKPIEARGDTLFYESFDKCASVGGNDGNWGTTIASSTQKFATDNAGWEYEAGYAGYQCARFGNSTKSGETTTPVFAIDGEATLTFRATAWNNDGNTLLVSVSGNTPTTLADIESSTFTMDSFSWKEFSTTLHGTGNIKLTFTPVKRFLLDEVLVLKTSETTGIADTYLRTPYSDTTAIYTLDGRYMGNSLSTLPRGIYIVGGRKIVK